MNVVEMGGEIAIVSDQMLPEPALPDILLSSCALYLGTLGNAIGLGIGAGEGFFDQSPPRRVVGIVVRKPPNGMKVIGKDNLSLDLERMTAPNLVDRVVEQLHNSGIAEQSPPLVGHNREEIGRALDRNPSIAHVVPRDVGSREGLDPTYVHKEHNSNIQP